MSVSADSVKPVPIVRGTPRRSAVLLLLSVFALPVAGNGPQPNSPLRRDETIRVEDTAAMVLRHNGRETGRFYLGSPEVLWVTYRHEIMVTAAAVIVLLLLVLGVFLRMLFLRRRALAELTAANRMWDAIINSVPFYFFVKDADRDFRYLMANRKLADFHQLPIEEFLGKNEWELARTEDERRDIRNCDERAMSNPDGREYTAVRTDAGGRRHYLHLRKKPFVTDDGKRLLLGAAIDATMLHNLFESEKFNSEALSRITTENDFDKNLDAIAEPLRCRFGADRVVLATTGPDGSLQFFREWRDPDFYPFPDSALADFSQRWAGFLPALSGNELIQYADLAYAPELSSVGIGEGKIPRSLIVAPIFAEGVLWGAVAAVFVREKRFFCEVDENMMRGAANIVSLALVRARQQAGLERTEHEQQLILNNIRIPIWLYDAQGRMIRVNTAVCELAGRDEATILQSPCRELFCRGQHPENGCPLQETFRTCKPVITPFRLWGREYLIHTVPILDAEGRVRNVVKTGIDVTELNSKRAELEVALRAAQAADKAKSFFLASMSHEIRTPLNAVIGFAELLRDTAMDDRTRNEYLNGIALSGNALLALINDVLDLSRLESGQMVFTPVPTDLSALLREIGSVFRPVRLRKGLEAVYDVPPLPTLYIDKLRLRQILFNLMGNALKFTERGELTFRARFTPVRRNDRHADVQRDRLRQRNFRGRSETSV